MLEPPAGTSDGEVLEAVRRHWSADVDAVTHLPVGFGAHHWAASSAGAPVLFVTLDALGRRHDLASLARTYAAAADLATAGLAFVHAGLAPWAVPLGAGALSVTPWLDGRRPAALDVAATTDLLVRLHAAEPLEGLRRWHPLVDAGFADDLAVRTRTPWDAGPLGAQAHSAIVEGLGAVEEWVASYHRLAGVARDRTWVTTHGQPGTHNQVATPTGLRLVDWESMMIAPAERDLRTVGTGDAAMLEMFALEWALDEISIGASRFERPHSSTADDHETLRNLLDELSARG